jgi:lipopolysaccharide/colanic/teichoic acid biosynthesis glycosyltransferase
MENILEIVYIGSSSETINDFKANEQISISEFRNRFAAEKHLKSGKIPDAIFCEKILPGGDGFEMHEWVRQQAELNNVSFIILVFEFREELYKESLNRKIDDFYVLPLPAVPQLLGRIQFLKEYRKTFRNAEIKTLQGAAQTATTQDVPFIMPKSKRIFDIVLASGALLALSPILLIVIAAIRLESKGKVYYISKRVGAGGRRFDFYKLRSMRTGSDADLAKLAKDKNQYATAAKQTEIDYETPCPKCSELPEGEYCSDFVKGGKHPICEYWFLYQKAEIAKSKAAFIKIVNDPRITKVGRFIRNTSIDELPQLINVIKGDMSIVGNRPLPDYEANELTNGDSAFRFDAPAGITGLWQVELRGKGGDMSEEERKKLDVDYSKHFTGDNYSFWYDFGLILRTFKALFQKDTV